MKCKKIERPEKISAHTLRFQKQNLCRYPYSSSCEERVNLAACECNAGFIDNVNGDGKNCENIDECTLGTDTCAAWGSICTDTPGSYTCACIDGFTGSGTECTPRNV